MRTILSFNPEEMEKKGNIIEKFFTCPGILSLCNHSHSEGCSAITCSVSGSHQRRTLYVPEQRVNGFLDCHMLERMRYAITKVSSKANIEPEFWLVACSFTRYGYLLPIDTFSEDEIPSIEPIADEVPA